MTKRRHKGNAPKACKLRIWTLTDTSQKTLLDLAQQAHKATRGGWWRHWFSWGKGHRRAMPQVCGFTYTPNRCRFFILDAAGHPQYAPAEGEVTDWREAYEVRLFSPYFELRGLKEGDRWRLALWADGRAGRRIAARVANKVKGLEGGEARDVRYLQNEYLLWGELAPGQPQADWTKLTSARIGPLHVPVPQSRLGQARRVKLETREYFAQGEDGNWTFAGERLTQLTGATGAD